MQSKRLKSGRCWQKGILVLQGEEEVNEPQINAITEEMVDILQTRGTGLHPSEIIPAFQTHRGLIEKVDPVMVLSLALRSNKVKRSYSWYAYLPEWGGPRRLSTFQAVQQAFDTFQEGVTTAKVATKASELLGREVSSQVCSSILTQIGSFQRNKSLWFHLENGDDAMDEEED